MPGRRPLSQTEERQLLRVVWKLPTRDRTLVTAQWLTGFRISEILSLTVGSVLQKGGLRTKIGVTPKNLKGHYGSTRWVPVLPELERALKSHLHRMRLRYELTPDLPLFISRNRRAGEPRSMTRSAASRLLIAQSDIEDDGRLGTHSLRKTFARSVYRHSGNDLMVLKRALGHSSVSVLRALPRSRPRGGGGGDACGRFYPGSAPARSGNGHEANQGDERFLCSSILYHMHDRRRWRDSKCVVKPGLSYSQRVVPGG